MEKDLFMDKHDKYYGLSTRNRVFVDKQGKNDGFSTKILVFVDRNMNRRVFIEI